MVHEEPSGGNSNFTPRKIIMSSNNSNSSQPVQEGVVNSTSNVDNSKEKVSWS